MPNLLAYIVLLGWLPVSLLLFRALRPVVAATITFLGGMLLLPANWAIDFPGFPAVDRHVISGLGCLIGYLLFVPRTLRNRARLGWAGILIATQVLFAFISIYMNPERLRFGDVTIPGLSAYDALGMAFIRLVTIGIPFFVGFRLIRGYEDALSILRVTVLFGLAYMLPIAWEVRMSPQLHKMLYGYLQRDFLGAIRGEGFRPMVFTSAGLEVALFMATAMIASVGLWQMRARLLGIRSVFAVGVLLVGLVLCKTLGSLILGLMALALMISSRARVQAKVALFVSFLALLYPFLRSQDMFPTTSLVEAARVMSEERAHSLEFRFENEDLLLKKARERPLFGWGTYGRNLIYDPETGRGLSTPDGYWIVELGMFGLSGFLSFFGLLVLPIVSSVRRFRFVPPGRERALVAALLLMVLVRTVDLIPNAFYAPFTMFLAGALMQFGTIPSPRIVEDANRLKVRPQPAP